MRAVTTHLPEDGSDVGPTERLRPKDLGIGNLFERVRDAVVVADAQTQRIVLWNPAATKMFGYAAREALELRVEAIVPDRLKAQHRAGIARYAETGHGPYTGSGEPLELPAVRKDGREIDVELSLSPIGPAETPDGGGRFVLAILRDVTERKRTERSLQAYAKKLETSNRELEEFVHVASHDLQEPLRKVAIFGERLRNKYADALGEQGLGYLRRMEGATVRMQNLIEDLLSLSRVTTQANPFEPVDLAEVVPEVLSDLEARLEETGGTVEVGDLPTVEADRSQMRQLLQNLIGNALKFHKDDVPPVVKVYGAPENGASTNGGRPPRCRLVVEDNGIGFDESHLSRIFVPFERLHGREAYEGMGMGLAICRKVVERHGGEITATSSSGQGAAFIVTLPVGQP